MTQLEQPNGQTHEKTSHQSKEQGQTIMWRYALEMKAIILISQATHNKNPKNTQVSEANGIQQVQQEEQYIQLQPIMEYQYQYYSLQCQGCTR